MKSVKLRIAKNLRRPQMGILGSVIGKFLQFQNGFLEEEAVNLLKIDPSEVLLEIGYGPGIGLHRAALHASCGTVYGLEISRKMMSIAEKRLKSLTNVKTVVGSVCDIPLSSNLFDKVFHVNCYYFWDDMPAACNEIYRVLRPGGTVLTTLRLKSLRQAEMHGFLEFGMPDPVRYMSEMEAAGFVNVAFRYHEEREPFYESIVAYKPV